MKKYIYCLFAAAVALASCSKNEGMPEGTTKQFNINVNVDNGANTRAAASADRYVLEMYSDAAYTTAANVFEDGASNRAVATDGAFSMVLDRTKEYYCLLWADNGAADNYDVTSLKAVTLKSGQNSAEAWQGKLKINAGTDADLSVTIKRAVAKISLMEIGKVADGVLVMTFDQKSGFSVATGTTLGSTTRTETINVTAADGTTTKAKLNTDDIFVLAPVGSAELTNVTFKMDAEDQFTVPNVPLKANFNTNITGHYTKFSVASFNVDYNDAWETPDNDSNLQ